MFTGIIEGFGKIKAIKSSAMGSRFSIESEFSLEGTKIGDSIAVNGACLTAVTISGRNFEVDVAPETISLTTHKNAGIGERVNLERALRLSDRLDGHLVSGHIDGTGKIISKKNHGNAIIVSIEVSKDVSKYLIKKGSVAIDGISLTINKCHENSFELSIIPHTAKLTTIGFKDAGDIVNIETDIVGKYIEKFVLNKNSTGDKGSDLNMEFLAKSGFL